MAPLPLPVAITEARRLLFEFAAREHTFDDWPNVIRMTPEQYQELNTWCEKMRLLNDEEGRPWNNPVELNRLMGMEIETHSGPIELVRDQSSGKETMT